MKAVPVCVVLNFFKVCDALFAYTPIVNHGRAFFGDIRDYLDSDRVNVLLRDFNCVVDHVHRSTARLRTDSSAREPEV